MASKRRRFSPQFKVDAVMDLLTGAKTASTICRERNITDKLLYRWKQELLERLPGVFERERVESDDTPQRVAELERMVGRLALENEILKNAASWREANRRRNE
jgi:transposase-like protein